MQQYRLGEGPYGSAYRGTIADLFEAGDLKPIDVQGRSFGLFLGHFDWQQSVLHTWQEPAKGIRAWLTDQRVSREHKELVPQVQDLRFTGDQHQLIVASSGAGKFRDVLSNMLLYDGSCETACLIIDPKGEIASTIGPMIDAPDDLNARTVILDPWDVTGTGATDSLTLLDGIRADNPHCVKDARVLAEAIIIERSADDGHWAATAKSILAALLLYLGLDPIEENERTLFRLRQIVTTPWDQLTDLFGYMSDSPLFEGLIARAARAMLNRDEKERRAILSTLERDTAFVEDPGLWKAIKTSSFDMNELVMSNKRLHVIVPFDYTDQMSSWLRLTIAAFYNACLRNQLPKQWPTYLQFRHIIIDEFAGLGKLDFITKGIAEARGAGIKYHLVVQNFAQLHNLYKEGWENLISNSFIRAFGINDNFTAEYLSKMTGQSTVITQSTALSESKTTGISTTSGSSSSSSAQGGSSGTSRSTSYSSSTTSGTTTTISSTGRAVLMPDEIRRISGQQQLLFLRQMPVILARRTPYFQIFQRFMPTHTLRDVLSARRLPSGQHALVAIGTGTLAVRSPLTMVHSAPALPRFSPPDYRRNSFGRALVQSPRVIIGAVLVLVLGLLWIQYSISASNERERRMLAARESLALQAAQNAEAAKKAAEDRKAAAEADRVAGSIDARMTAPYSSLASSIIGALAQNGVCVSSVPPNAAFQCPKQASYEAGSLAPIQFDLSAQRKVLANFSLHPQNEKRGAQFTGALATMTVQSVFENVNFNSDGQVPAALKAAIVGVLHAFQVSDQVASGCLTTGTSETSNGTTVSCRFVQRPIAEGGLAQFVMTLGQPM